MKRYTIIELGKDEEHIVRYALNCEETAILNSVTYRKAIDYIYEFMEPSDLLQEMYETRSSMLLSYDDIQNSAGKKAFDNKRKR